MDPFQVLEERWKHIQAHRHAAGEAQPPAQRPRVIGDRAECVADVLEDALSELHQALGGRRHPDLPAHAQEQRLAQFLLEQQDLPADGRLRDAQLPPARGERSGLGNRLKDLELSQVHASVLQNCRTAGRCRWRRDRASAT